jgi:hypothetical protein
LEPSNLVFAAFGEYFNSYLSLVRLFLCLSKVPLHGVLCCLFELQWTHLV